MISLLVILIVLGLLAAVLGSGRDARRTRESQERMEKHALAQLPPPAGFEDVPADAIACVREANDIGAIVILHRQGMELDQAKQRVKALRTAIEAGPAFGRPRATV